MKDFTPTIISPFAQPDERTFIVVGNHYINLASVQCIEAPAENYGADDREAATVYFVSGNTRNYYGDSAIALRRLLESSEFRTSFVRFDASALPLVDDDAIWGAAAREATQP